MRGSNLTNHPHGRPSARVLAQIVLILTTIVLSSFTSVWAEEPPSGEESLESIEVTSTEPVPTETPEPIPTESPQLTPTETPEPTPTDTPEPIPTEAPEPTPTNTPDLTLPEIPEPAPTETPAPTPTKTPQPTPTETSEAIPTVTPGRQLSGMSATASSGACRLESAWDLVGAPYGEEVRFYCENIWYPGHFSVSVSAPTDGWSYGISRLGDSGRPRVGPTPPEQFESVSAYSNFQIDLGRVDTSVTGCGQITVTLMAIDQHAIDASTLVVRTVGTDESCEPSGPEPVTASLVGGELPARQFSFASQTVDDMSIEVSNPSKTTGWSLVVRASDLTYDGDVPGDWDWPASSLQVVVSGVGHELPGRDLLVTNTGGSAESHIYPVTLTIPGGAPVGTYSGTITISTTDGVPGGE